MFQASTVVAKLKSSNTGDRYLVYVDEKLISDFTLSSKTWSNVTLAKVYFSLIKMSFDIMIYTFVLRILTQVRDMFYGYGKLPKIWTWTA